MSNHAVAVGHGDLIAVYGGFVMALVGRSGFGLVVILGEFLCWFDLTFGFLRLYYC